MTSNFTNKHLFLFRIFCKAINKKVDILLVKSIISNMSINSLTNVRFAT